MAANRPTGLSGSGSFSEDACVQRRGVVVISTGANRVYVAEQLDDAIARRGD
jgi:hypothetical protein